MTFADVVRTYIAEGEALMTAPSPEIGKGHENRMQLLFDQIMARSRENGFPAESERAAWQEFQDWEAKHGVSDAGP